MAAPADYFANVLGNSLEYIQAIPEVRELGHGVGLAFDMAQNAPMNTAYNVPHYAWEDEPKEK